MAENVREVAKLLGASVRDHTQLLRLYIPAYNKLDEAIDYSPWVRRLAIRLAELFGGATAIPVYNGEPLPVEIYCYTLDGQIEPQANELQTLLQDVGAEMRLAAFGLSIDDKAIVVKIH